MLVVILPPFRNEKDINLCFDGWLLGEAQKQGARVENERVSGINFERGAKIEVNGRTREYDLVVLASGVNTKSMPVCEKAAICPGTPRLWTAVPKTFPPEVSFALISLPFIGYL